MLTADQIINNWQIFGIGFVVGFVVAIFVIGIIQIIINERRLKKLL